MSTDRGRKPPPDPLHRYDRAPSSHGRLFGLGFQFAAAIVLCVFVGQWVDRRFGVAPWGVLIGAFVGFAAGFHSIYRTAMDLEKEQQSSKPDGTPGGEGPA